MARGRLSCCVRCLYFSPGLQSVPQFHSRGARVCARRVSRQWSSVICRSPFAEIGVIFAGQRLAQTGGGPAVEGRGGRMHRLMDPCAREQRRQRQQQLPPSLFLSLFLCRRLPPLPLYPISLPPLSRPSSLLLPSLLFSLCLAFFISLYLSFYLSLCLSR